MSVEVARRYQFAGRHHVPGLAFPWSEPHRHQYTVEVVAAGELDEQGLVVDTDALDARWGVIGPDSRRRGIVDLDDLYEAENTTVERLAQRWLGEFRDAGLRVTSVTVWEDDDRWGRASA